MSAGVSVTTESTGRADLDLDELRANLRQADPGVLVAVLAQLTGDAAVVDRFAPKISHVPDPPEQAGVTDPETAAALVEAVVAALRSPRPSGALPVDDLDLFARIAPVALGGTVGPEYLELLLEQGGFHPSRPVLPRTAKLPAGFKVVIIGAGIAGITAALACADAGIE
ncbi:pyridine nucleotide-disulfide oxidoreductase family protein [Mycobacterium terramassiliense]|uniref:Pyridine nucleotide-disulfide oxidoreductase family protein n=1 Tax=Mycobacterium terramassiliense TaxID=1841859 RepID=A0A2U3N6E0_9MYCO|nr:pyridine nucleotide-disulfide oxidoreductase family protein [Mycobacterium terramassiliense]